MKVCMSCKKEIEVDRFFSRTSVCPKCGGDLHICLNCVFYSERAHNKCLEPKAEFQRVRDRANFCDYFKYREEKAPGSATDNEKEEARKKLDDLFSK